MHQLCRDLTKETQVSDTDARVLIGALQLPAQADRHET